MNHSLLSKIRDLVEDPNIYLGTMPAIGTMIGLEQGGMRESRAEFAMRKVVELKPFFAGIQHSEIPIQSQLLLHRESGVSRITHILRTLPPTMTRPAAAAFDKITVNSFLQIAEIPIPSLDNVARYQIVAPFRCGGHGIRSMEKTAAAAYIGAFALVAGRIKKYLHNDLKIRYRLPLVVEAQMATLHIRNSGVKPGMPLCPVNDDIVEYYSQIVTPDMEEKASALNIRNAVVKRVPAPTTLGEFVRVQRIVTYEIEKVAQEILFRDLDQDANAGSVQARRDLARLRSCAGPLSATGWTMIPSKQSHSLANDTMKFNIRLRLGRTVVESKNASEPRLCPSCGSDLCPLSKDAEPNHLQVCRSMRKRGTGSRHDGIVKVLVKHCELSGGAVVEEPYGHNIGDKKSVDYVVSYPDTTIEGDVTIGIPTNDSYCTRAAHITCFLATDKQKRKDAKHSAAAQQRGNKFVAVSGEAYGAWGTTAVNMFKTIATQAANNTDDPGFSRQRFYVNMVQDIAAALFNGNAFIARFGLINARHAKLIARGNGARVRGTVAKVATSVRFQRRLALGGDNR